MNQNDFLYFLFSNAVNQSIANVQMQKGEPLTEDQADEQEKMLRAIHDFSEAAKNILPKYTQQVMDACIAKAASEFGWQNGGQWQ